MFGVKIRLLLLVSQPEEIYYVGFAKLELCSRWHYQITTTTSVRVEGYGYGYD